jgi:hypothetical protein
MSTHSFILKTKFMARSKNNISTHGLSGKVDKFVFRHIRGRTFVCKAPRNYGPPSEAQLDHRARFRRAVLYAKAVIDDYEMKLFYSVKAKEGQSAFNAAFSNFFEKPDIGPIDISAYNGVIGGSIVVPVNDHGLVVSVKVKIHKSNGSLVEEGDAILQPDALHWVFTVTKLNDSLPGSFITVAAMNLPGNTMYKQIIL